MRKSRNPYRAARQEKMRRYLPSSLSEQIIIKDGSPFAAGVPEETWESKRNVRKVVEWLAKKTRKRAVDLNNQDFIQHGLNGVVTFHSSVHEVLKFAGIKNARPWERRAVHPTFWDFKDNRVDAIRWLFEECKKKGTAVSIEVFRQRNLSNLLFSKYYGGNALSALVEAGLMSKEQAAMQERMFFHPKQERR
ncbi:Uncharacterised protein [uncultured archaeon]|nr:Uncharacterised protein [uncultured archaeon]